MLNTIRAVALLNDYFSTGKELQFARREHIIPVGIASEYVYLIEDGIVNIFSYGERGNTITHFLYKKNDLFPINQLTGKGVPGLGFAAFTNVTVKRKPQDDFLEFLSNEPGVLPAILNQQSAVYERVVTLSSEPSDYRLAKWLLTMADKFGTPNDDRIVINVPMTVQELADCVRLSRESTGKLLGLLERNDSVMVGRNRIVVYPERLRAAYGHRDL